MRPLAVEAPDAVSLRNRALGMLARREHSSNELRLKLSRGGADPAVIDEVLQQLADEGLQSDTRFAESLTRQRVSAGHGPLRVLADLRAHGIDDSLIASVLDESDPQWLQRAAHVRRRRFGSDPPRDARDLARQFRFLQYRGFSGEQARRVIDGRLETGD